MSANANAPASHEETVYDDSDPMTIDPLTLRELFARYFEGELSDPEEEINFTNSPGEENQGPENINANGIPPKRPNKKGKRNYVPNATDARRDMRKLVAQALKDENTYTYTNFSLQDEITRRQSKIQSQHIPCSLRFDGTRCRSGRDREGKLLWVALPGALRPASTATLSGQLVEFGRCVTLKKGTGADKRGRGKPSAYRQDQNTVAGVFNYVVAWTGIGHDRDQSAPSGDSLKSAKTFVKAQELVSDLSLLSHRMNAILEAVDPAAFKASVELRDLLMKKPYASALGSIDPLLWVGRSIIFNRTTPNHRDRRDNEVAWTPLVTLGDSQGGDLRIPVLGTDLFYEPGTIIFIRGGTLEHSVLEWTGNQRIAIAHFTHYYVWEEYGVVYPV